ncbi:TetR/AcrR family transcriptional regulator [Nocardia jiangsuensis]|uniref:TetR/AcrR family transcriptional regulator n=1 Tax=Nocardia jiangsuensis TaxID=1691563 RepID=A0ABV8DZT7_9NOCA
MAERWTRERRLEHTRGLLLEAAQEVFAEKGFTAATLDDIAYAAGYTKGAIYKHFSTKEELFLAVNEWYWQRYFDTFTEVVSAAQVGAHELDRIAELWQRLSDDRGAEHAALGMEFTLYLLRNPEARERVAARREQVVEALARFITEGMAQVGATLAIPPLTFARILVHTTDSVVLGTKLDDIDLHRPVLEMYMSVIKLP